MNILSAFRLLGKKNKMITMRKQNKIVLVITWERGEKMNISNTN